MIHRLSFNQSVNCRYGINIRKIFIFIKTEVNFHIFLKVYNGDYLQIRTTSNDCGCCYNTTTLPISQAPMENIKYDLVRK